MGFGVLFYKNLLGSGVKVPPRVAEGFAPSFGFVSAPRVSLIPQVQDHRLTPLLSVLRVLPGAPQSP